MSRSLGELVLAAKALGLDVSDTLFRHETAGIGHYASTSVGPEFRALTVVYSGPVVLESTGPVGQDTPSEEAQPRTPSADPTVRALGDDLLEACRREGVCLWFGHSTPGIGCLLQHTPSAAAAAGKLAEDIRVTRMRALNSPGVGHEQRLVTLESTEAQS